MTANTAHFTFNAIRGFVAVVMVVLGTAGLVQGTEQQGNGLPVNAPIQSGSIVTGHEQGNFNDEVLIDATQVGEGR